MGHRGYRPASRKRLGARIPWAWWHPASNEGEEHPRDRRDCHPEARLPILLFRAMGSGGPHIYCKSLADAVQRLARGLEVLRGLAGLERQASDP